MHPGVSPPLYRCAGTALVRAAAHAELALPAWPELTDAPLSHAQRWWAWLRQVWALDTVAEAVEHASPVLARQIHAMCAQPDPDAGQAHRAALSVARYVLRMTGRATPFGLFAGVAPAGLGPTLTLRWGNAHRSIARADAAWIAEVIGRLEACPQLLERLPLMANNLAFVRGDRLVLPYPPKPRAENRPVPIEASLRYTPAVRIVVQAARSPIRCGELAGKLAAEFPTASAVSIAGLLRDLVERGVLISSLHAPSTVVDAFVHLMQQLEYAGAGDVAQVADLLRHLRGINDALAQHHRTISVAAGRSIRTAIREKMTALSATTPQPLAVDLRLDCALVLPPPVAREAEAAASALARLSAYPFGTSAWKDYHNRPVDRTNWRHADTVGRRRARG